MNLQPLLLAALTPYQPVTCLLQAILGISIGRVGMKQDNIWFKMKALKNKKLTRSKLTVSSLMG